MNYSTAIFLVNPDVRAIKVSYEVDAHGKGVKPYQTFKSLDPDLCVGEYVVIPTDTRHKMTVARVEEIEDDVDFDSPAQLDWIIDTIRTGAHEEVVRAETAAIEQIKSAEKRAKREELARKLIADNPDIQQLKHLGDAPAITSVEG